jgi:hypothetical protein
VGCVGWQQKKINCPPYGDHGNQFFLVSIEGLLVASFFKNLLEGFAKTCENPSFLGD